MSRVLVTGCNGFIGSHLVEALIRENARVTGTDVAAYAWDDGHVQARGSASFTEIRGDLVDENFTRRLIDQTRPEIIFHLASVVGVNSYLADPLQVVDVNIIATRNLLKSVRERAGQCRFVFSSTSEIYGFNPEVPWREDSTNRLLGPTRVQRWAYSSSKAVAEHVLWAAYQAYHLPVTVVRFFNVYGPRQRPELVVPAMVKRALLHKPVPLYDGGSQTRCFTYVQDAVEGLLLAATKPEAAGEVFNIGSSRETTIRQLFLEIKNQLGPAHGVQQEEINTQKFFGSSYQDIPRRLPDVQKAKRMLGWEAKTGLSRGIAATIAWWKKILLT